MSVKLTCLVSSVGANCPILRDGPSPPSLNLEMVKLWHGMMAIRHVSPATHVACKRIPRSITPKAEQKLTPLLLLQGISERLLQGCVKSGDKVVFCLPFAGRKTHFIYHIFSQHGKSLLAIPCTLSLISSWTLERST